MTMTWNRVVRACVVCFFTISLTYNDRQRSLSAVGEAGA